MAKQTMGSKRNSVKVGDAVDQSVGKEETKGTKIERKSAGQTEVQERPATKRKLGGDRPLASNPFWYLNHTDELESVTSEGNNPALGIKEIKVFEPSDAQWNNGMVANCILVMDHVELQGIQVLESNRDDSGALYMRTQSRSWEKDGQKQYKNDITLSRPLQAQILSFVEGMLVEA